jgi:hypothetical protein
VFESRPEHRAKLILKFLGVFDPIRGYLKIFYNRTESFNLIRITPTVEIESVNNIRIMVNHEGHKNYGKIEPEQLS